VARGDSRRWLPDLVSRLRDEGRDRIQGRTPGPISTRPRVSGVSERRRPRRGEDCRRREGTALVRLPGLRVRSTLANRVRQ